MLYQKALQLNSMRFFIMKTPNKQEFQQIEFNSLSDIDFMKLYKNVLRNHILF